MLWQRRLHNLGINPSVYTFPFFASSCVVYLKMPFHNFGNRQSLAYRQFGKFYIGSTSIGAAKREFNSLAKLKMARAGQPVHVELAVKYWAKRQDFEQFTILVIKQCSVYRDAWVYEHLLLSKWQAPLNYPISIHHTFFVPQSLYSFTNTEISLI